MFRVTWKAPGTYEFKIDVIKLEGSELLAETTASVSVNENKAMYLTWDPQPPANTAVNTEFTVGVKAELSNYASELDHALYIIEVQKDGQAATTNDFEIVGNPEGIMGAFRVDGEVLRGYWGPAPGFLFRQKTTSTFPVKFHNPGTYQVAIYAIQVPPVESVEMTNGLPAYFSWYYQ